MGADRHLPSAGNERFGRCTTPDTPVVVLDRVVFTMDNRRPVEWRLAHSHLPGSYYLAELR